MKSRVYPKKKKKKERRSRPLKRSVHINGERWGWEYQGRYNDGVWENERVIIYAPDNRYFEVDINIFEELFTFRYGDYIYRGSHTVITPSKVKNYILSQKWAKF